VRTLAIALIGGAALLGVAAPAAASDDGATAAPVLAGTSPAVAPTTRPNVEETEGPTVAAVDVLQVSGLFDDIVVNAVSEQLRTSATDGAQALILQVNSRGAVVSDDDMADLLGEVAAAEIPVAVWVGPSGARLYGTPAQLLAVADVTGMAPGSRVGYTGAPLDVPGAEVDFGTATDVISNDSVGLSDARELGVFRQRISDEGIATIANMVDALDGYEEDGVVLDTTTETVTDSGTVQRDTIAVVRFFKLPLVEQLFHTVWSPAVTYLLLLTGLALLVFEFFTAGVGVAGVVGAGSLILACTGLAALPTRPWAAALIVLAMLAFAVDVQVGIPRLWTGIGLVLTIVGSMFIFESIPGASLRPSWITLIPASAA
jgi:membrane-bound serine protease (ClpP class)